MHRDKKVWSEFRTSWWEANKRFWLGILMGIVSLVVLVISSRADQGGLLFSIALIAGASAIFLYFRESERQDHNAGITGKNSVNGSDAVAIQQEQSPPSAPPVPAQGKAKDSIEFKKFEQFSLNDEEFELLLYRCMRHGFLPLMHRVWFPIYMRCLRDWWLADPDGTRVSLQARATLTAQRLCPSLRTAKTSTLLSLARKENTGLCGDVRLEAWKIYKMRRSVSHRRAEKPLAPNRAVIEIAPETLNRAQ